MSSYTITNTVNFNSLSGKEGGNLDTYNIEGGIFIIDSDTRYGVNTTPSTGFIGNINISNSLGGKVQIRGNNIRAIPFTSIANEVPPLS